MKTHIHALLILAILPTGKLVAQTPWTHQFHSPDSLTTSPPLLVETANGDIVSMCHTGRPGGQQRVWFLRLAANGTLIADKEFLVASHAWIYALAELPDGRIVATGASGGNNRAFMMLLGPTGDLLSWRTMVAANWSNIQTILVDPDSNLTASFWTHAPGLSYTGHVAKIDPDASQFQATQVSVDGLATVFEVSSRCADGGAIHGAVLFGAVAAGYPMALMRTAANGTLLWALRIDAGIVLRPYTMVELPDGGLMVAGLYSPIASEARPFAMRTDSSGEPIWTRYFEPVSGGGTNWSVTSGLMLTPDLFLLCGGEPSSTSYCIAVDTAGDFQYARRWSHRKITDLQYAQNGDLLLALEQEVPYWIGTSPALLRMENDLVAACPATAVQYTAIDLPTTHIVAWSTDTVTIPWLDISADITPVSSAIYMIDLCGTTDATSANGEAPVLRTWPNPTDRSITVEGTWIDAIQLTDATGRLLQSIRPVAGARHEVDLRDAGPGVYILRVRDDQVWRSVRLVKE